MTVVYFLISLLAGYLIARLISGRQAGDKLNRSLLFKIGNWYFHLHHWFIGLTLIFILYYLQSTNWLIYGLIAGLIIQGLTYRDRFIFFYRANNLPPYYKK